jgi:hypothetical protein
MHCLSCWDVYSIGITYDMFSMCGWNVLNS